MIDIDGIKKRIAHAKTIPDAHITPHHIVGWLAGQKDPITFPRDEFYHPAKNVSKELDTVLGGLRMCILGMVADAELLLFDVERLKQELLVKDAHRDEVRKALGLPDDVGVVVGASLVVESRDNAKRERNELLAKCEDVTRERDALKAELDELRTRHARLTESTDTFVAALVDERFKKDHAAMLAELHEHRTRDIYALAQLKRNIDAMPETVRAIYNSACVDAKSKGVPIIRALVDMVANARGRASCHDRIIAEIRTALGSFPDTISTADGAAIVRRQRDELSTDNASLRDECRKHLARINVLESEKRILDEAADVLDKSNAPPGLLVDRIEWLAKRAKYSTCVDGVHWVRDGEQIRCVTNGTTLPANVSTGQDVSKGVGKANDAPSANVVPADVIQRAANWATSREPGLPPDDERAKRALAGMMPDHVWYKLVREFVKLWCEGQAPDEPRKSSLHGEPMYTCPPTSEYDNPCPRHGIVGMEFSKHPDVP